MKIIQTVIALLLASGSLAVAENKPSILFCCPGENRYGYVGYDYLQDLVKDGFVVDYLEGTEAMSWEKIKHYNVLFVYGFPPRTAKDLDSYFPFHPPLAPEYIRLLDRFVQAGGGVFLHVANNGYAPNDLLQPWGVQLPLSYLRDAAMEKLGHMRSNDGSCLFTDQILPSPVSQGVHGLWYPIDIHYTGAHTMPLLIDANWMPVVKASKSTYTVVPTFDRGGAQPLSDALIPREPIKDPVLFAIREFPGGGRMAAIQTWFMFSVGSGKKWMYENAVLERGLAGRPSDYGKLLENTYRWLAAPSLKGTALGGAVTDPARLLPVQLRPGALEQFQNWDYQETAVLNYRAPDPNGKLFRGVIGAQTALSGGSGTVADYAQAARDAKLDFVVFLEDLARMTPEKLQTLKEEVKKRSSDTLQLFAGYRMHANTGNDLFVFGPNTPWPDDRVLVGPDKRTFNLQYQDASGKWAPGNPSLDWALQHMNDTSIGYYNFTRSGAGAMGLCDLRAYSTAALRTYQHGELIEDMTPDYLTTVQSTSVPTPVSLNLVSSPQEMIRAIAANQALTYAQARTLSTLYTDSLRWSGTYDGLNVFPSDGPLIQSWPRCLRAMTFGAESFVSGRALWPSPIQVTSEVGLREIRIYDGRELFRRFLCHGKKEFATTLFIPGTVQRNMVLIAEDTKGGKAVSFAYRQYKEGNMCVMFCGDHVNDFTGGVCLLAHGTLWPSLQMVPFLSGAGDTWDGGPSSKRELMSGYATYPGILTTDGVYDEFPYQLPLLEFSDGGAVRSRMVCTRQLIQGVPRMSSPWHDFGPLEPTTLCDMWASHTFFDQYKTGVEPNSYGAPGVGEGPIPGLFTEHFTFKKATMLQTLRLFHAGWRQPYTGQRVLLVTGKGGQLGDMLDVSEAPAEKQVLRLATGSWLGLFSGQTANTHLYVNRGAPLRLEVLPAGDAWLKLFADRDHQPIRPGDTYDAEIFSIVWPMNERFPDAKTLADVAAYLAAPTGLRLTRGKHVAGPGGLLELAPDSYAVELSIPKPNGLPTLTVPVRVSGFNKRWSVGLYQLEGYRTHYYSKANSGYRALGLDFNNCAYVPLYVSMATNTHVRIGHPIIADKAGHDLFIEVTRLNDGDDKTAPAWHVSVNNPGDKAITTKLRQVMDLPGLDFRVQKITLQPGEYRVLTAAHVATRAD